MKDLISKVFYNEIFADTRIGTNSKYEYSNGNTLPLVGVPHGQNYFSVQTAEKKGSWWFNPKDITFEGFRLTHQPSPWMGDFSHLTILPFAKFNSIQYYPGSSIFKPSVNKIEYMDGSKAILTASKYDAIINYEAKESINFSIKAQGLFIEELNDELQGKLYVGYVVNYADCEDQDFTMHFVMQADKSSKLIKISDQEYTIALEDNNADLRLSTSFISRKQALYNFSKMSKNQKSMLEESVSIWNKYLNKIEIDFSMGSSHYDKYESYDRDDKVKFFYHALYRCFLFPMTFYEIDKDGNEIHFDTKSKTIKPGKMFTNIGFWDAQKTLFPLLALIARDDYEDILEGILNFYKDTGFLPKWLSPDERGLMPGVLVDNVIADACVKDISCKLMEPLFEAMLDSSQKQSDSPKYLKSKDLGNLGESMATSMLELSGHLIIERNWRAKTGEEIDIISTRKGKWYITEVKTRSNLEFGTPSEAINKRKIYSMNKAFYKFLNSRKLDYVEPSIEIVEILVNNLHY